MNLFLRAKHWQIFLFTFGLPLLIQVFFMVSIFASLASEPRPDPEMFLSFFKFFPALLLVSIGTLFSWMWSVGMGLQKMLPPGVTMKTTSFKIFFFFPLVYFLFLGFFIAYVFTSIPHFQNSEAPPPIFFAGFAIIFPLHFFTIFCMFYNIHFVAKTIKTVELQREVSFSDYIGEFFLVWFHFIGVWILQPRINKIQANHEAGIPQGPFSNFS